MRNATFNNSRSLSRGSLVSLLTGVPDSLQVVGWVLVAIATGVIFARIYLRLKIQRRRLLVSDALMVAAWVFAVAEVSSHVIMMNLGRLDKEVGTTPVGFHGNSDMLQSITKVIERLGQVDLHAGQKE